jgi:hypothetical protein
MLPGTSRWEASGLKKGSTRERIALTGCAMLLYFGVDRKGKTAQLPTLEIDTRFDRNSESVKSSKLFSKKLPELC